MACANWNCMSASTPSIVQLASLIDLKRSRLEAKLLLPFQRKRLVAEIEALVRRFQIEYREFIEPVGEALAEDKRMNAALVEAVPVPIAPTGSRATRN